MATIRLVPENEWETIKEYLYADYGGAVVLMPENNLVNFSEEQAKMLLASDGETLDYSFGGEPDLYVEIMQYPDTFCAEEILSELSNRKGK